MRKPYLLSVLLCSVLVAKHASVPGCGTHEFRSQEELFLHQRAETARSSLRIKRAAAALNANRDAGNIAIIDDSDGVVARRNPFNLNLRTLAFSPSAPKASRYKFELGGFSLDTPAAENGTLLSTLGDDDAREVKLPFAFPFYGVSYTSVFINSNGNLTFGASDADTTDQSLGRLIGGAPRIAALFDDLDPTAARVGGVKLLVEPARAVITWDRVPEYSDFGFGQQQTFQIRIHVSGLIEIAYDRITALDAVAGISPGNLRGTPALIPFIVGSAAEFAGPVAEVFAGSESIDIAAASQKFYATHGDSYDFLVFFNALNIDAGAAAVAFEVTVRNERTGYGDRTFINGGEYGSPRRLQAVMNMGPLGQYPRDPNGLVELRRPSGDTPLTVLGHEAGHLFLAFASVRDEDDNRPMLGRAGVHWAFTFNSEASLMEGNRIQDNGAGASPRFTTIKTVEGYSLLDRYLMGLIPPSEVPPTFVVTNASSSPARAPQTGVAINGVRRDVTIEEIIGAEGRRTPDSTVAQRNFRFAFVLISAAGAEPSAAQIAQVEAYRAEFEKFFATASGNHAAADATLKRALRVSVWPAAGVVKNATSPVTVTLDSPAASPLTIFVDRRYGIVETPASVTIPAGASTATFDIRGVAGGVEELSFRPADTQYETVEARIQVQDSRDALTLSVMPSGQFRVSDINQLPYAGVRVLAGGVSAATNERGEASLTLAPGTTVSVSIEGAPSSAIAVTTPARPAIFAVTNAASYTPGITSNAYATIFGANLGDAVQVLVNGELASMSYVSPGQINFLVPPGLSGATATVTVVTPRISSIDYRVQLVAVSPGIFAVVNRGTALEIYATGLNGATPDVTVGGQQARVLFTGQPQFPGLDQVNVLLPALPPGQHAVVITALGQRSNAFTVAF